jgi:7-cyano-7-deazaguanine synthase
MGTGSLPPIGRGCVLLLSGGLDSSVLLAMLRAEGWPVNALTVLYGQRHEHEILSARHQAKHMGCARHEVIEMPRALFRGSALTDADAEVPQSRDVAEMTDGTVPSTYVPARNLVLLSLATAWAESLGLLDVFIAVNAVDYSGYPDCRPEFVESFARAATLGTRDGIRAHAPLVNMTKREIVSLGDLLEVDFANTSSCYRLDPEGRACGTCDSCTLRRTGFEEADVNDTTRYVKRS